MKEYDLSIYFFEKILELDCPDIRIRIASLFFLGLMYFFIKEFK